MGFMGIGGEKYKKVKSQSAKVKRQKWEEKRLLASIFCFLFFNWQLWIFVWEILTFDF